MKRIKLPIVEWDVVHVDRVVAWYDLWVGVYISSSPNVGAMIIYVLPLPCLGFRVLITRRLKK